jgi:triosephosphate isomerase
MFEMRNIVEYEFFGLVREIQERASTGEMVATQVLGKGETVFKAVMLMHSERRHQYKQKEIKRMQLQTARPEGNLKIVVGKKQTLN